MYRTYQHIHLKMSAQTAATAAWHQHVTCLAKRVGTTTCPARSQEGLPFLLPYVTRQRVQLSKQDFVTLLEHRVMMMPEGARQDKEEGDKQEAEKECGCRSRAAYQASGFAATALEG